MAYDDRNTVVGVFRNEHDARQAIAALKDAGFTEEQIGLMRSTDQSGDRNLADDGGDEGESYAGEGAAAGLAAGAGVGALWGLGILAGVLPAIGPAIAGGTLAVLLSSAAAGAAAAGIAGALIGMGLSKEEAEYYESEVRAGRTIVTVHAGGRRDEAVSLLQSYGAYDMNSRTTAGYGGSDAGALHDDRSTTAAMGSTGAGASAFSGMTNQEDRLALSGAPDTASDLQTGPISGRGDDDIGLTEMADDEQTVRAHEERLRVDTREAETGEVSVRKEVHTEHETIEVPVTREEVVIERRTPHAGEVSASDLSAGEEIRIPVREEQVNVEKETVAVDEVSVGKRRVTDTERVDADLRKEEIRVDVEGEANVRNQRNG